MVIFNDTIHKKLSRVEEEMAKDLVYWQTRWNSIDQDNQYDDPNHPRVLGLLLEYTEALGVKDDFVFSGLHGSRFFRFFTRHLGRNHVDAVTKVISRFFGSYTWRDDGSEKHYYSTEYLLGHLKAEIGTAELNPFGDLALIFEVIKQNTNVDFESVTPVSQNQLDKERDRKEMKDAAAVITVLDNLKKSGDATGATATVSPPKSKDSYSILPLYDRDASLALLRKDKIPVKELKSLLMKYKSSSYFFGDTPEITSLKALCHNKIRAGVLDVTENEVREAISSATGWRSQANRVDLFSHEQQQQPSNNTSKTIAQINASFNEMRPR